MLDSAVGNTATTGYENTIGLTQTWSPTFITDFRFGFFRNNSEILPPSDGINDQQTLGIANQYGDRRAGIQYQRLLDAGHQQQHAAHPDRQ